MTKEKEILKRDSLQFRSELDKFLKRKQFVEMLQREEKKLSKLEWKNILCRLEKENPKGLEEYRAYKKGELKLVDPRSLGPSFKRTFKISNKLWKSGKKGKKLIIFLALCSAVGIVYLLPFLLALIPIALENPLGAYLILALLLSPISILGVIIKKIKKR